MPERRPNQGGRPPAGPHGERVRSYKHQLTSRLRGADFHTLAALAAVTNRSYRDILSESLAMYLAQKVTRGDRAAIAEASTRAQRNCPRCRAESAR